MDQTIHIRILETLAEMEQVEALHALVWPGSERDIVPGHLMLAIAHNGGLVLGAYDGPRLVGFLLGFLATDPGSPDRVAMARLKHVSHELGVHPEYRNRGLGALLKRAQRDFVVRQGIRLVTWTYDPLLSRNAHLNIRVLGAVCRTYFRDYYGEMRDELNAGLASDRFQVEWWVTSRRVESRLGQERPPLDLAHYLSVGAQELNPGRLDERGLLQPAVCFESPQANLALVEIPSDFPGLKQRDLGLASAWRDQTRGIFESAFAAGYMVTDFIHLRGERFPRSFYVMAQGEATLG